LASGHHPPHSGPLLRKLLQTLYQAGSVFSILLVNGFCLLLLAGFWLALTARKTRRTLE
jgi:ABC-2 type transport system permease protein